MMIQVGDSTEPTLRSGQAFGGFRIHRLLGQGGMGEVYEATQEETGRLVALKVMSQRLGSETDRKRFLREGRLAASISHPNTIYIFGSAEIENRPVIIMELARRGTLKERVETSGPMPLLR
jgi:serine/threonine protein kinase